MNTSSVLEVTTTKGRVHEYKPGHKGYLFEDGCLKIWYSRGDMQLMDAFPLMSVVLFRETIEPAKPAAVPT